MHTKNQNISKLNLRKLIWQGLPKYEFGISQKNYKHTGNPNAKEEVQTEKKKKWLVLFKIFEQELPELDFFQPNLA